MGKGFAISGGRELIAALKRLERVASVDVLRDAANEGAKAIVEEAQRLVPVKSGDLRDSIQAQPLEQANGSYTVGIGSPLPYARRIEYGFNDTDSLGREYHQPAQPYLRPALDTKGGDAVNAIADVLAARVREAAD